MFTGPTEMLSGSVMRPEKVVPAVTEIRMKRPPCEMPQQRNQPSIQRLLYCSKASHAHSPTSIAWRMRAHHSVSSRKESQVN